VGSRRTLILIAAVLIGAIAAYALYSYVNGVEDRAYKGTRRVAVFKVVQPIPKGTHGEDALKDKRIVAAQIPQEFFPATAVGDLSVVNGKVALTDLAPGQVLVQGMFVDESKAFVTFADRVPVDQVAITISLDQVHAVAGLLVPGDRVNMLVTIDNSAANGAPKGQSAGGAGTQTVRYLYQNVQILAIGQIAAAEPGSNQAATNPGSGLITFNVPPDAAQRIALVGSQLYLTLAPKDYKPVDLPPVDLSNLFQPGVLTPYPNNS